MAKQWYTVAEALQFTADHVAPLPKSGGHRLYARSDWFPPDTVVGQFTPIRFCDDAGWFPPGVVDGPFCPLGAAFTPIHFKTAEEAVNSNVKGMHWLTLSSMVERGQLTLRTPVARAPVREWNPYSSMEEFENYLLSEPEMRTFCAEFGIVLPSLELIPEAKAVNVSSSETTAQRQERRYQMCIDAGLHMPGDDYSRLPRGINRLAKLENITRQAFSEDVKAHINRLNKR